LRSGFCGDFDAIVIGSTSTATTRNFKISILFEMPDRALNGTISDPNILSKSGNRGVGITFSAI